MEAEQRRAFVRSFGNVMKAIAKAEDKFRDLDIEKWKAAVTVMVLKKSCDSLDWILQSHPDLIGRELCVLEESLDDRNYGVRLSS